jgi:hypothetical protein
MTENYEISELQEIDRPTGPVAAAILATGIAMFALGVLTTLAEASTDVADSLNWSDDVGPLSGKTLLTALVYFVSWGILHALWRRQNRHLRPILVISAILAVLGIVGTFPTFFEAFAPE